MASLVVRRAAVAMTAIARVHAAPIFVRCMASRGADNYPTDRSQATGVTRKEALVQDVFHEEYFDRDAPSFADTDIGTKENPIPVFSIEDERVVGVTLHDDNMIRWFTLKKDQLAFDPVTHNYFALKRITEEEVDAAADEAEKRI